MKWDTGRAIRRSGLAAPLGSAGHDPRALTGGPLGSRHRAERLLVFQHRVDRLQHRPRAATPERVSVT